MITLDYLQCSTSPQHADKWAHLRPTHFDFLFLSSLFPAFALIKLFLLLLLKNSNHDNGINEVLCSQRILRAAARCSGGTTAVRHLFRAHLYIHIFGRQFSRHTSRISGVLRTPSRALTLTPANAGPSSSKRETNKRNKGTNVLSTSIKPSSNQ